MMDIKRIVKGGIRCFIRPMTPLFKASPSSFQDYSRLINVPAGKIYRHYIYCCYRYATRPEQYIKFDFYRLNNRARRKFAGDFRVNRICDQANIFLRNKEEDCYGNKQRFHEMYRELAGRDYIVSGGGGVSEVFTFLKGHHHILLKPINGLRGIGVRKIDVTSCDPEKLAEEICKNNLVVEEVIEQCEEMAQLNRSSINTIRVVNVRDKSGVVHTVGCSVRVGRRGMVVDNVMSGGIAFPLDVENGFVCGKGIDEAGHLYDFHPDSGQLMIGYQIPRWRELLAFTVKAMDVVPQQRLVGWDVGIGKDRFYLIEGNLYPGAGTFEIDGIGKKHLLELAIE